TRLVACGAEGHRSPCRVPRQKRRAAREVTAVGQRNPPLSPPDASRQIIPPDVRRHRCLFFTYSAALCFVSKTYAAIRRFPVTENGGSENGSRVSLAGAAGISNPIAPAGRGDACHPAGGAHSPRRGETSRSSGARTRHLRRHARRSHGIGPADLGASLPY